MSDQRVCAVIPAAGAGTRLGLGIPKITLEIADGVTVWHLLHRRLSPWVRHVHVIVSPAGEVPFRALAADEIERGAVTVSVQARPTGMGDAIFGAVAHWEGYDRILVVWGDQVNLSPATVRQVVHAAHDGVTLPLVPMRDPYVEYELDGSRLVRVRMSREGDDCRPGGLSDVGVFGLGTDALAEAWTRYLVDAVPGAATGEINFLPFLPYLSQVRGLPLTVVPVTDADEARGVNTPDDLEFARRAYQRCPD